MLNNNVLMITNFYRR